MKEYNMEGQNAETETVFVVENESSEALQEENNEVAEGVTMRQVPENKAITNDAKPKNRQGMILTVILLVAVAVLYVLFFTKKDKISPVAAAAGNSSGLILTVNNDSIVAHFVLVEILKSDLEKEMAKYQAELQKKSDAIQEKYRIFKTNVDNNVLTQTQMQNGQNQLMQEQAALEALQAKYTEIMSKKEVNVHREIMDSITNATRRINDAHYKADYVFATSDNSPIFYSNPAYDITKEVIEELNNAYNKTHKK